ncbi:Crp/Fnr family transcriptional regulator [Rhodobacteraceae bacterium CCMM004]|nr:Crp/Fnr family transcriptional regulator [Rhodobacteraceae bacterium CCMM004]
MVTACASCPLRKMPLFTPFSEEEVAFMQKFKTGELTVDGGSPLLAEGSTSPQLYTVLDGMGLRYKTLPDGRRQVINFVLPGDFLGMQSGILGEMQHSVESTTHMRLCVFNRSEIFHLFRSQPQRAFDLTWLVATEEHFLGEALATVGQRSAMERIAWAFVKLYARMTALGGLDGNTIRFPYKQQDLADALGLSLVHTNKTLAKLRERQLVTWSNGELRVMELEELAAIAQLELEPAPIRPLM